MKAVWKFHLGVVGRQMAVDMPAGAEILTVQEEAGEITAWARVDPCRPREEVEILYFGTGHPIRDAGEHIATVQAQDGRVWHFFHPADSEDGDE